MATMKDYSQNGEQAHILHYLEVMGIEKGHLVDLGAGDGFMMSNTRALLNRGWTGHLFDGDPKGAKDVHKQWIDKDSAQYLMCAKGHIDFLNIDLDGNDYHILEACLVALRDALKEEPPALIVAEINPIFQRYEWAVMPYNESHVWKENTYYGMSLAACEQLANEHGYELAYLHAGINAFLIRDDMAEKHPELMRPIEYRVKFDHRPHTPEKQWLHK